MSPEQQKQWDEDLIVGKAMQHQNENDPARIQAKALERIATALENIAKSIVPIGPPRPSPGSGQYNSPPRRNSTELRG